MCFTCVVDFLKTTKGVWVWVSFIVLKTTKDGRSPKGQKGSLKDEPSRGRRPRGRVPEAERGDQAPGGGGLYQYYYRRL